MVVRVKVGWIYTLFINVPITVAGGTCERY
jgi:hypothetical protein